MRNGGSCLNCPRCGLSIAVRSPWLVMTHCPRCVARARTAVELISSEMPASVPYAAGLLPSADTLTAQRQHVTAGQSARDEAEPVVAIATSGEGNLRR